jgi:hypothetical protein
VKHPVTPGLQSNGSPKTSDHTTPLTHPNNSTFVGEPSCSYKKEALSLDILSTTPPQPLKEPSFFIIMSFTYSSISIIKGALVSASALVGDEHKTVRQIIEKANKFMNKLA